jgi:hypothetical protein
MEAPRSYETSANFYEITRRNIPEACHFHIRRRQNLKSYQSNSVNSFTPYSYNMYILIWSFKIYTGLIFLDLIILVTLGEDYTLRCCCA